jgi:hypothetical protein
MKKDETLYVLPVGKKKEDIKVVLQEWFKILKSKKFILMEQEKK